MSTVHDTNDNRMESNGNIVQLISLYNRKHITKSNDLNILKTGHVTKSKARLKVPFQMITKMSLYNMKNLSGDDSRYPTISHKKMHCAKKIL